MFFGVGLGMFRLTWNQFYTPLLQRQLLTTHLKSAKVYAFVTKATRE